MVLLWYYNGNIMVLLWYYHLVYLGGTGEEHKRKNVLEILSNPYCVYWRIGSKSG